MIQANPLTSALKIASIICKKIFISSKSLLFKNKRLQNTKNGSKDGYNEANPKDYILIIHIALQ